MSGLILFFLLLCSGVTGPAGALAHESQPATLELQQIAADRYRITWRVPIYYGRPHPARVVLPDDWRDVVEPTVQNLPDSRVYLRIVSTGGDSPGDGVIHFPGLEKTITDVFIREHRLDGTTLAGVAGPGKPSYRPRGERAWHRTAVEYTGLGFHHILQGSDHLLFILGLLTMVGGGRLLLATITSFTAAHSLTLALATLGYVRIPLAPLNAAIALSILFLGAEIVRYRRGETSLTIRYPWLAAFFFGLLHGFGFASGLTTTGMPKAEIIPALLFFNVGVELGQLVFVAAALALRRSFRILEVRWPPPVEALPGYAVGGLGAYWTIQRTMMLLGVFA